MTLAQRALAAEAGREAYLDTRLSERAAIVAWLRSRKDQLGQPSGKALRLADAIEAREHRNKE